MTDCGCEKAKAELEEYLHHELDEKEVVDITDHLENCEDCTGEHLVGITLINKVKSACQEKAPQELADAIRNRLETA
jgi:anti-sigma factor (TIGR02949 family)